MLPVKSTKAQLQAANEVLVCAVEQLMNRVADLQEENNRLIERLRVNNRPDVATRSNHDRLLEKIWGELQ